jgi:hypothetical protein
VFASRILAETADTAKFVPKMVTEFPPDVARFTEPEYETTGESNVNSESAVPARLDIVTRTFPVPTPLTEPDAH